MMKTEQQKRKELARKFFKMVELRSKTHSSCPVNYDYVAGFYEGMLDLLAGLNQGVCNEMEAQLRAFQARR